MNNKWVPWILVGGGIAVGYYFYKKMQSSIRPFPQVKIPNYSYNTGIVPPKYAAPIQIDGGDISYQSDPVYKYYLANKA